MRRGKGKRRKANGIRWKLMLVAAAASAVSLGWLASLTNPGGHSHALRSVTVPAGAGLRGVGSALASAGIVRSAWVFDLYAWFRGPASGIQAGRYRLSQDMTLGQVFRELRMGPIASDVGLIKLTVPEGFTARQIARRLTELGICDGNEFYREATRSASISECHATFKLPTNTLEGYLFPDTYSFPRNVPPGRVIDAMLDDFGRRFAAQNAAAVAKSGKSLNQIVIEASIIEREAKAPQDRARIAGVINNRLKRKMPLDVDATVLYALGYHKSHVLYRDLRVDSPYNTYRHVGLPPAAISNPGVPSLMAALYPEHNNYLYYVAGPGGAHIFETTSLQHMADVARLRSVRPNGAID
ncbi:MAG: endolytic transglycosylase MltG [Armatimonadetes bacterium]|nr:endolytic transglycosylase MltG [Armatimonadota bacterium]MDE2205281.1 endolytic transglycosylase MltG [Armatimonadota bacterium]